VIHILVVESDPTLADRLKTALERVHGVCTGTAPGLREALAETDACCPDLILIDLNASLVEGFEVAAVLRSRQNVSAKPVVVLQRRRPGNERGHDAAPCVEQDVIRRTLVQVLYPSARSHLCSWMLASYRDDRLTADFASGRFEADGRRVELTVREQELLRVLVENAGRLVARRDAEQRLWGYETRSIDVHVHRLRQKLGSAGKQIQTVTGFGYRFTVAGIPSLVPSGDIGSGATVTG
jgi:DNA-binding response OmpR family regulator